MPTLFEEVPSLVDRIVGADLIVTGRLGRLLGTQSLQVGDRPRVFGLFEVSVEHVLQGERPLDQILVRILGDGEDEHATWIVPVQEKLLVLFLVRDVEPGLPDNVFAPYFASAFPITAEARVHLPGDVTDDFTRAVAEPEDSTIHLEGLERLIQEVRKRRETRARELQDVEPADLKEQDYPDVAEIPPDETGGGRPAAPEGEPPAAAHQAG